MAQLQTPANLQAFITEQNISARLVAELGETPTVPAAAAALGVESDQIIKTLLFLIEKPGAAQRTPVIVISNGESRVDKALLAAHFGVGKKRVSLAPASVVIDLLGYPAGGVPPFGHHTRLPVIVDAAILTLEERFGGVIFGGGGDDRTMMELTVAELLRVTTPVILALNEATVNE